MAFKNRTVSATLTTSNQDVYVAPNQYTSNVVSILVTNTSSSVKTVSMDWYDSSATTYHTLMEQTTVPANGILQITNAVWLDKEDKIRALASAGSSVEVTIYVEETFV